MGKSILILAVSAMIAGHSMLAAQESPKKPVGKNAFKTVQESTSSALSPFLVDKGLLRPQTIRYKYNEPIDLIELIPVIRDINRIIPRQFSLAEHDFRLDPQKVVIQHEFLDAKARASKKDSIISLSYTGATGQLGTRFDVPLFYSSVFGFSDWTRYPLGNYTMTINRDNPFSNERMVYIKALTRF